jgi:hypothetical protein
MIYLIITASINNRYGIINNDERKARYIYSISETLKILPDSIIPIIVENNGSRATYLDNFIHNNKLVKVVYTNNNSLQFKSKGVNEMLDILDVIKHVGMNDTDMVIKLTGRYRVLTPSFFEEVNSYKDAYDTFVKFYDPCSLKYETYSCILGYYAMRVKYLRMFMIGMMDNCKSAENAFAKYVRFSGTKIKEIDSLSLECCFADDSRLLIV